MARKIVITSGKGGVGKTTVCAGLGKSLAQLGFRVLLADFDIGLNNLDLEMGIEQRIQYDILDVLNQKCRSNQAIINHKNFNSLYILPSVHTFDIGKIDMFDLKNLMEELSKSFDFVLIDCPAGIETGFYRAVCTANEAIVVTTPHISAIRNANRVLSILNGFFEDSYLIVNRVKKDLIQKRQMLNLKEIGTFLDKDVLGIIYESDNIFSGKLQNDFSRGHEVMEFLEIAENLANGKHLNLKKISR